jgi:hypothetical protein
VPHWRHEEGQRENPEDAEDGSGHSLTFADATDFGISRRGPTALRKAVLHNGRRVLDAVGGADERFLRADIAHC